MAQELLLAGKVENITPLLKRFRVPPDARALMLLESQPQHIIDPRTRQELLRFTRFNPDTDFTPYTSGRVFHEYGELRWEQQQQSIQIVYTGDEQYKPEIDIRQTIQLDGKPVPREYYLFGKRLEDKELALIGSQAQKGDFAEVRIPRLLRYPAPQEAERVRLVVYEYIDDITGANIAFRFVKLVGAE